MAHRGPIGINALAAAILFSSPTSLHGDNYYASVSNPTVCSAAALTSADTCHMTCDSKEFKSDFDCGNAGTCNVDCTMDSCFEGGSIYAANSDSLSVSLAAANCVKGATITAATETEIDCTGTADNECKAMMVAASSAQYLKVTVRSGASMSGDAKTNDVSITCPQNSAYTGPDDAPCMIDISAGGTMADVNIFAPNGLPADVQIVQGAGTFSDVFITCAAHSSTAQLYTNPFTSNICYNTRDPTTSPTKSPSKNPSQSPATTAPTTSPTASTASPTATTATPTPTSASGSSSNPSTSPTNVPSKNPTPLPSAKPSAFPSLPPTDSQVATTNEDDQGQDNTSSGARTEDKKQTYLGLDFMQFLILSCTTFLICTCCIIGYFVLRRLKKYQASHQENIDKMQLQSNSAGTGSSYASSANFSEHNNHPSPVFNGPAPSNQSGYYAQSSHPSHSSQARFAQAAHAGVPSFHPQQQQQQQFNSKSQPMFQGQMNRQPNMNGQSQPVFMMNGQVQPQPNYNGPSQAHFGVNMNMNMNVNMAGNNQPGQNDNNVDNLIDKPLPQAPETLDSRKINGEIELGVVNEGGYPKQAGDDDTSSSSSDSEPDAATKGNMVSPMGPEDNPNRVPKTNRKAPYGAINQ